MELKDGKIRVQFTETGSGLIIGQQPWCARGVTPFPKDKLIGFFLAGEDKKWIEADATIAGDSVVLSSAQVPKPVAVRYGWANSPRCNLYNQEGLPASPFRTDDWTK
jgi:sialate O-acetylesterase